MGFFSLFWSEVIILSGIYYGKQLKKYLVIIPME